MQEIHILHVIIHDILNVRNTYSSNQKAYQKYIKYAHQAELCT